MKDEKRAIDEERRAYLAVCKLFDSDFDNPSPPTCVGMLKAAMETGAGSIGLPLMCALVASLLNDALATAVGVEEDEPFDAGEDGENLIEEPSSSSDGHTLH